MKGLNVFVILNKCDLGQKLEENQVKEFFPKQKILKVSATKKIALKDLESAIVENIWHDKTVSTQGLLISNLRHIQALQDAQDALDRGKELLNNEFCYQI